MWESLVVEFLRGILSIAGIVGGVAGAGAGIWLASTLNTSATVAMIALVVGLFAGAKGTRFLVSTGIEQLERLIKRSA